MVNALSTLVGEDFTGQNYRWFGSVSASNGSIYSIPYNAFRVMKFDPISKSINNVGPDLGENRYNWSRGAITDSGIIYFPPRNSSRGILKIDTNTDNVTELNRNLLPERGNANLWISCAVALDGCIYCMPNKARRIMKIDPNNNDAISSVGDDLGHAESKYIGIVVGIDGCVYGIPNRYNWILKYNPINDTTSYVGEEVDEGFYYSGSALGRDGCIYAITRDGRIMKIDRANNAHCFVGNSVESDHHGKGWVDAILGIDGCIYCPPLNARYILKYDPHTNRTSLVGDDFGRGQKPYFKWCEGSLASDGVIYCFPYQAKRILAIDPWKEYTSSLKEKVMERPEQLGCIFHPSDDIPKKTNFDRAVTKFGHKRVLEILEDCLPPVARLCAVSNLYPFMIAASYINSDVGVIYHLLRQVPSFVSGNNCA